MPEAQSVQAKRRRRFSDMAGLLLLIVFLPILAPAFLMAGIVFVLYRTVLTVTAWAVLCRRGTNTVFVTSDSPNWNDYLQNNIISRIRSRAVVLNWSEHTHWKRFSLPVRIFFHFAGSTQFNPIAIVFRPFHRTRVFRFWQPFKDHKHGKTEPLKRMEEEFFTAFGTREDSSTTP
jgi:hypothetical protein